MEVNILDCTLRDGGYVNNWDFKNSDISTTIEKLLAANIDIIECGFLNEAWEKDSDSTRFNNFATLNTLLSSFDAKDKMFVAMIEAGKYNINSLPQYDDSINVRGIRYAFRKSDKEQSINDMKKIKEKGYLLFIQPISTNSYNDLELKELLELVNEIKPYSVYIVDTQGSMFKDDFRALFYYFDKKIDKDICLGFHSHNNMQLSYSIAIDFIEIARFRNIIIDVSVYGMGRGAGNLNTELVADYINKKVAPKYTIERILELIDEYYYALYTKSPWGYSLAHFLSASIECHPNYASYLLNKKHLSINQIRDILLNVSNSDSFEYNKDVIEKLYYNYNNVLTSNINEPIIDTKKDILIIGSGKNIREKLDYIKEKSHKYTIIALNHLPKNFKTDYVFFNNEKRYREFEKDISDELLICTNNIAVTSNFVLDYSTLSVINDVHNDNSVNMILNYLSQKGFKNVLLAGIDGFKVSQDNYNYHETDKVVDIKAIEELNNSILEGLQLLSKKINIQFLTDSIFKSQLKKRIIGVIPARYASTRLPGKPLLEINGLPMIIHVLKRVKMAEILDDVIVATDDQRIFDLVEKYNGKAVLTSEKHTNGTERMYEVAQKIPADIYVLINGDEALVNPNYINNGVEAIMENPSCSVSLLYNKFYQRNSPADFKVVVNKKDEIMYISRNDIPSEHRNNAEFLLKAYHIMSFTKEMLDEYVTMEQTAYDYIESHELLRLLENGHKIQGVEVDSSAISVDTQDDLIKVRKMMKEDAFFPQYKDEQ